MKKLVFFALLSAVVMISSCGNSSKNDTSVDSISVNSMIDTIHFDSI